MLHFLKIFASQLTNVNYISICPSEGVSFTEYSCLQLKMKIRRIKIKKIVHADASVCNEEKRSSLGGRVFDNHANIKRSTWIDGSRICGRRPCNHFSRVIIDRGCRPTGPPRDGRMVVNVHISFDSGTAHGLPWSDHHSSRFR